MRGKILWSKNQEKNLVDYSQEMIYHYNTEGRHIAKKKKDYKISKVEATESYFISKPK